MSSALPQPTRRTVSLVSANSGIVGGELIVLVSDAVRWYVEVDSTTSQLYNGFSTVQFPDPVSFFDTSAGAFVNVFAYTAGVGLEIAIDECVNGSGITPGWRRALSLTVTPGILAKVDGFRINQSAIRVSFINAGAALITGEQGIKIVTL